MIGENRNCEWCGAPFTITNNRKHAQKYCSVECYNKACNNRKRIRYAQKKGTKAFAKEAMREVETGKLDKALEEAKAKGLTYAEWQKQNTLALYGRFNDEH